ncbi:MAG: 30S ribosomal protein S2 [Deltaproteobacteria bacterium]|nr:30S ribosomal protein S2 [Deltaproteobacteria bacterium]
MATIGMREMLEAGAHFGHQTRRWNPKMKPYIFGARNGIYIIDLQQTLPLFETAYKRLSDCVAKGGKVLFIATKKQAQETIALEAVRAGQYYINNRWLGGMLTNFKTIKLSVDRLRTIEKMQADGTFERLPKKEVIRLTRELEKLEKNLAGIRDMNKVPDMVFVIDPQKEHIAIEEARRLNIPVCAVVDTNCNPDVIDLIIPANDDAIRSIQLFCAKVADACVEGAGRHQEYLASKNDKSDDKGEKAPKKNGKKGPKVDVIKKSAKDSESTAEASATPAPEAEKAEAAAASA